MSLRTPDTWQHTPLLLRFKPGSGCRAIGDHVRELGINSKQPVEFETDVFKGRVMVCLKGVSGETDPWGEGERFAPKKRCTVITVQGRVKRRLRFDEVLTGWEWEKPLTHLPWGTGALLKVIQTLYPGFDLDLHGPRPHFLNTLCVAADGIHKNSTTAPSQALDITKTITPEGLSPEWKSKKERKQHVQNHLTDMYYEPDQEYTFDINGDKLMLSNFTGIVGMATLHFAKYLNGQPFPLLARTSSGECLWNLELWHRDVLRDWDGVDAADLCPRRRSIPKPKEIPPRSPPLAMIPTKPASMRPKCPTPRPAKDDVKVNGAAHDDDPQVVVTTGDVQALEEYLDDMDLRGTMSEKEPDDFSHAVELIHSCSREEVLDGATKLAEIRQRMTSQSAALNCAHFEALGRYRLRQIEAVKELCDVMLQLSDGRSRQAKALRELCRKKEVIAAGKVFMKRGEDTSPRRRFLHKPGELMGKKRWLKLLPHTLEVYSSAKFRNPIVHSLECAQVTCDDKLMRVFLNGPKLPSAYTISVSTQENLDMWFRSFQAAINPPQLSFAFAAECDRVSSSSGLSFYTPESVPSLPPASPPEITAA